jgi:hypothetical protein
MVSACVAIIPLAGLLGEATEPIAERAGEGIGGLLSATVGYVPIKNSAGGPSENLPGKRCLHPSPWTWSLPAARF